MDNPTHLGEQLGRHPVGRAEVASGLLLGREAEVRQLGLGVAAHQSILTHKLLARKVGPCYRPLEVDSPQVVDCTH